MDNSGPESNDDSQSASTPEQSAAISSGVAGSLVGIWQQIVSLMGECVHSDSPGVRLTAMLVIVFIAAGVFFLLLGTLGGTKWEPGHWYVIEGLGGTIILSICFIAVYGSISGSYYRANVDSLKAQYINIESNPRLARRQC